ncbi:putative bifunctional diguanylate cyclase/phosphodiesterase [Goekera deserti]|uniref:Bifunctional diguanylate cyclase/phosphodiesterase n=1 Tax=Goekera deserti TaxID=2497753 RepID=A0A7K3WG39_9ACTN|nr:bifunctional diguanylate cyclase/phosphodiesterase [Goekera deserti]NDI47206.1 EAL domain-containing protein [Goekera deserti]NEL55394.1 bifunctional diguanylate cyclase/phosphodiesterase [Goekera deserti]
MATPRVMARTLSVFFLFGGVTGSLVALGAGSAGYGREVLAGLSLCAVLAAAVAHRWGLRWRRNVFHLPLAGGGGLILAAVSVSPDPASAVVCAAIMSFVIIDVYFFFSFLVASTHLAVWLPAVTAALLAHGTVSWGTTLALDVIMIALGVVTRELVVRASGASRDPLTDLRNRRGLDDALRELMVTVPRTGERLSAALLDLDNFKTINDTQGHDAGDAVLREVADVWRRALPPSAVLARHGGDEFALLLPGVPGPAALELVRRLCALHPDIRLSCGVAEYVVGDSAAQLMRRADQALYAAKAAGRGRCELDGGEVSDLARDLAVALTHGDVAVHFQPILQVATDDVVGVEALARWTHPERGPVSPSEFVAVAEQHGLITALGEHVLRQTCTQLAALHAATGRRLRVGVNVSGIELSDPTYPDRVRAVFADTGWPAEEVVLEVTESLLDAESATSVATLHALRDLGLKVAIDDFGTGYSSLSRLDTLPIDVLKVDHSFIAAITTSPRRTQMLRSIVALAGALGMDVVAEGVETPEQDLLLRSVGCTFEQGWLHGRPMPVAELQATLERRDGELTRATG